MVGRLPLKENILVRVQTPQPWAGKPINFMNTRNIFLWALYNFANSIVMIVFLRPAKS